MTDAIVQRLATNLKKFARTTVSVDPAHPNQLTGYRGVLDAIGSPEHPKSTGVLAEDGFLDTRIVNGQYEPTAAASQKIPDSVKQLIILVPPGHEDAGLTRLFDPTSLEKGSFSLIYVDPEFGGARGYDLTSRSTEIYLPLLKGAIQAAGGSTEFLASPAISDNIHNQYRRQLNLPMCSVTQGCPDVLM